jgi:hypothetical protein
MKQYEVKIGEGKWRKVTLDEWIEHERNAGFYPKSGDGPATAGFSRWAGGVDIEGRIVTKKPAKKRKAANTLRK